MENVNLNYKFVICNNSAGNYYDFGYKDLQDNASIVYYPTRLSGQKSIFTKLLIRLTFSKKVNQIVKEPFKRYTFKHLFPHDFDKEDKICYIFFCDTQEIFQSSYIKYLRDTYPNLKLVLYMHDLVEVNYYLDINRCRNNFDLLVSYDKGDCRKYEMLYYPTPMSYYELNVNEEKTFDLYFCGRAKTRYELLYQIYDKATSLGLKCDFYLYGLPKCAQRKVGINYPTKYIPYEDNLRRMKLSKCVVDIMQENADGYTPRVWDSIINDLHLLSDNTLLPESHFYRPESMHSVKSFLDSVSYPRWIDSTVSYSIAFKKQLSPYNLLHFVERYF